MSTSVNWFEIPVSDMQRAVTFYEHVFECRLHLMELGNGLTMATFPFIADQRGGALCFHPDYYFPGDRGPLIYLDANPRITDVVSRVEAAGGKVHVPVRKISDQHGSMAVFIDPEGNRIALHSDE